MGLETNVFQTVMLVVVGILPWGYRVALVGVVSVESISHHVITVRCRGCEQLYHDEVPEDPVIGLANQVEDAVDERRGGGVDELGAGSDLGVGELQQMCEVL